MLLFILIVDRDQWEDLPATPGHSISTMPHSTTIRTSKSALPSPQSQESSISYGPTDISNITT
jgi:hypothetical protein